MHYYTGPFCGCYIFVDATPKYLPQLKVDAHTTILDTTSRTTLTQTFINPYSDKAISELKYIFPLYDGVSVVAFTCTVSSRVIKGVVKERQKAKQVYEEARARGETAGLFEQSLEAADVFTTSIGNVPAGEKVKVEITYLGELKHDAEVDGVRFTIPTQIVPRYGSTSSLSGSTVFQEEGMSFTVDAEMPEGSAIKSIQSPSHPISVSIGTVSTAKASDEPSLRRASATLTQGTVSIDKDFIIQVVATKLGEPAAFVETHPTIPNQRALMATLVPKFKLPAEKPEIVFMCDRSGSMCGNIPDLVAALNIFLKSLPLGVKFNICSFGSSYSFLWEKSKTYSQESLNDAVRHVNTFQADMGGTEMYDAVKTVFNQRYSNINLEIFLLTDGAIWDQERLFGLINETVIKTKGDVRVFTLGVGTGASTALIEGVARAGNGFSQTVENNEKMDKKVVRMLKASLFPHIKDYSLEIKYEKAEAEPTNDEEFEIVEKVFDSLSITTLVEEGPGKKQSAEKPKISLFDRSVDDNLDTEMLDAPDAVEHKYDHLPAVPVPRYLQTPTDIPPLYPLNRTTVYVLLSNSTPDRKPKSVVLKGTSKHGPLELEIPIVNLAETSTTIHQLAARKEVKELEEGRGWLSRAKDDEGKLLKEKHEAHFSDMVEREAVRLGVEFQVGGKWCSFVAVEEEGSTEKELDEFVVHRPELDNQTEATYMAVTKSKRRSRIGGGSIFAQATGGGLFGSARAAAPPPPPSGNPFGGLFGSKPSSSSAAMSLGSCSSPGGGGLFGSNNASVSIASASSPPARGGLFGSVGSAFKKFTTSSSFGSSSVSAPPPPPPPGGASLFSGCTSVPPPPAAPSASLFGAPSAESARRSSGSGLGGSPLSFSASSPQDFRHSSIFGSPALPAFGMAPPSQQSTSMSLFGSAPGAQASADESSLIDYSDEECESAAVDAAPAARKESKEKKKSASPMIDTSNALRDLASLQTFVGSWAWDRNLEMVLGTTFTAASALALPGSVAGHANKNTILATVCAVVYFKKNLKADKEAWEMLVEKAEAWLEDQIGGGVEDLEKVVEALF